MTKKIISILLIAIFLMSLCACTASTEDQQDNSGGNALHSGGSNDAINHDPVEPDTDVTPSEDPQSQTTTTEKTDTEAEIQDTQNIETSSPSVVPSEDSKEMTYEEYNALSAEKQQEYFNSFATVEAFFDWYNAAKSEYEKNNQAIEIEGDGSINLSEIVDGKK